MKRAEVYQRQLEERFFTQTRPYVASITAMKLVILSEGWDEEVVVNRWGEHFTQQPTGKKVPQLSGRYLNEREMRTAFEEVDTPDKLEQFLKVCGPFYAPASAGKQWIEWPEFQEYQELMRQLQQGVTPTAGQELQGFHSLWFRAHLFVGIHITPLARSTTPRLESQPKTALEVIADTIAADLLDSVRLRKCDGCPRLYPVETLHDERERGFCSDTCRHRDWQRKNRPSKREANHAQA